LTNFSPGAQGLSDSIDNGGETARPAVARVASASIGPEELVQERLRKFMKLLPEVLNSEHPEAVHDLRVWSRRLQQVLATILPRETENRASVIRALRRARRSLSDWRDSDVLMALLDRRIRRLHNLDELRAWQVVHAYLAHKREKEIRQARRKLAKRELFILPRVTEDLLKQQQSDTLSNDDAATADFILTVSESIKAAYADWQAALSRAAESESQADIHNFRIKTKRLRYRIELAQDLGHEELRLQLMWQKRLQDSLGQWHDQAELARIATAAIASANFLLSEPRSASLLLKRLARERSRAVLKVKSLLAAARASTELPQLEAWIANHSRVDEDSSKQAEKEAVSDQ
jgi:CHAD domain-containing protein